MYKMTKAIFLNLLLPEVTMGATYVYITLKLWCRRHLFGNSELVFYTNQQTDTVSSKSDCQLFKNFTGLLRLQKILFPSVLKVFDLCLQPKCHNHKLTLSYVIPSITCKLTDCPAIPSGRQLYNPNLKLEVSRFMFRRLIVTFSY